MIVCFSSVFLLFLKKVVEILVPIFNNSRAEGLTVIFIEKYRGGNGE